MKKYIFPFIVALSALSLAGAAAFFSVTGLSKLFGGAKMEIIIMASALEFAKLVTASFLHRYWKTIKWQMKVYLTVGVVTVMLITSAGIYGFLSNAYSTTSGKLQNIDAQIQMVEQKKTIINSEISRVEDNKIMKSDRVKSLVNLRIQQETRLDSLYSRRQIGAAKRVESQIEQANKEIIITNIEIDTLNNQTQRKYGEITVLELEILNLKNNDINGEVGPLKYIAKLTGRDMDSVVNFFILLLIFVFDPLAVSLIIATNIAIQRELGRESFIKKEEPELIISKKDVSDIPEDIKQMEFEEVDTTNEVESDKIVAKNKEEVISYVADETGEFKPVKKEVVKNDISQNIILEQIRSQGIEHNASYLSFLDILFKQGRVQVGELLPPYNQFLEELKGLELKYTEKEVKDFLTICNLFKITDMSGPDKRIAKEYRVAKDIISLLSK